MSAAAPRTAPEALDWVDANQRYLVAAIGRLRVMLEDDAGNGTAGREDISTTDDAGRDGHAADLTGAEAALQEAARTMPWPPAMALLTERFGLSSFERDLLLLCAGAELDSRLRETLRRLSGTAGDPRPSFGLALARLPGAHWSALSPTAPLRYWRLLEVNADGLLTDAPLQVDERILHYLTGVDTLDQRLAPMLQPLAQPALTTAGHGAAVACAVNAVEAQPPGAAAPLLIELHGPDPGGRRAVAAQAAYALGLRPLRIAAADLPASPGNLHGFKVLWAREAALAGRALLVDADAGTFAGRSGGTCAETLERLLDGLTGVVFLSARERTPLGRPPAVALPVPAPAPQEQAQLWHHLLGQEIDQADGRLAQQVEQVCAQFRLGLDGLRAATAAVAGTLAAPGPGRAPDADASPPVAVLWDACREQARPQLDGLAQRIVPGADWQSLVLPTEQLDTLRQLAVHVRQRHRVHRDWGLVAGDSRGLGVSALFSGGSGTGKTMAAEVLAAELGLDLYRIDLSAVVSKYIGETEKNLRTVFDAAEAGGAILLFDEADALFGKRTEVRDSHDRFANIEISYLLQRMEAYRGLAILTTNMKSALDTAFLRRLRFLVEFPFPDAAARRRIWAGMYPPGVPTLELDFDKLAHLNVAGGHIRNIALGAAFGAAEEGVPVQMRHLFDAARREYRKLDRPLQTRETRGWD